MPLLQPQLEIAIKAALDKAHSKDSSAAGNATLAAELAKAIHTYVIAATVNPGQVTVGSSATGGPRVGATTTPGTLS